MIAINRGEKGLLVLEDGTFFSGWLIGHRQEVIGEVTVHTGMTGYQEILTDPSVSGHIVTFTYPLIGNYGITPEDMQSAKGHAQGIIVQQGCSHPSNWRSEGELETFLREHGIVGLTGIDTRALARHVRGKGLVRGMIFPGETDASSLLPKIKDAASPGTAPSIKDVATKTPYVFHDGNGARVTVVDFGVRRSVLNYFVDRDCYVTVVPPDMNAQDILETRPDGIVVSNGPGDPEALREARSTVTQLLRDKPIFGIGLGHQLIALALGAEVFRLNHAHRGANHPVKNVETGRVYMTAQNHGWAVKENSWSDPDLVVSHKNVNDATIEGLTHRHLLIASVQYNPEGGPGPAEGGYPLEEFVRRLP